MQFVLESSVLKYPFSQVKQLVSPVKSFLPFSHVAQESSHFLINPVFSSLFKT